MLTKASGTQSSGPELKEKLSIQLYDTKLLTQAIYVYKLLVLIISFSVPLETVAKNKIKELVLKKKK